MPTAQQIQDAFRQYGNDKIKMGELVDQYRPNDSQLAQALGFTIPEVQAYLAESDRQRRAAFDTSPDYTPDSYGTGVGINPTTQGTVATVGIPYSLDRLGYNGLPGGVEARIRAAGGSVSQAPQGEGADPYWRPTVSMPGMTNQQATDWLISQPEFYATGEFTPEDIRAAEAGNLTPGYANAREIATTRGNADSNNAWYDKLLKTAAQYGGIALAAPYLWANVAGSLTGSESLATLGGNTGADAFAEASIWDSIGADLATGFEEHLTMNSLYEAGLSAGYTTEALAGLTAAELAALPEVANMIATGTSAAGTTMFPPGPGTQVGPLTPDIPGTQLPGVNPPGTPPPTDPPTTTPPGNPRLPNSVFNPPGTNNIPKLANLIAGGVDFGSSMYVADKYKEIFDQLLAKSDPFGGERSKYFPLVGDAVENAKQYNGLAFRGLNDPNFWTEQSWLKGIGDYSADATQRKLASQGYNYSGNTQHEVAKTLRDTMAQYVIPGQQNLISGANMAGNLVNTAGTLAGAQFNPAQAMGPLSNVATSGLNSFQNGIGSLFNNNGQPGQSLVEQGLGWLTNYWGDSSTRSTGSLTDGVNTSDYNNPDLDNWL